MANEKNYPIALRDKIFSDTLNERYNSLKYVSDYAGALTRLSFLVAGINIIWKKLVWVDGSLVNHVWTWYMGVISASLLAVLATILAVSMISLSWAILSDWLIGKPPEVPHNNCVRTFAVAALTILLAILMISVVACVFALFIYQSQNVNAG